VLASLQETCPPPTNQWGFLPERSTSGALLAATHDWLTELDKGNEAAAVFFDIKKPLTQCLIGCSYINFKGMDLTHTFSGGSVAISQTKHTGSRSKGYHITKPTHAVWGSPGLHPWTPFIHYLYE